MSLYQEIILDHYRNPRNAEPIDNPTGSVSLDNPLCGDEITLSVREVEGKVEAVGYEAEGCAISIASASMLSETIIGKDVSEVQALTKDDVLELLGIELTPNRLKCALLPLEAVKRSLYSQKV